MSERLDCFASEPHYARHLLPLWQALEPEERGVWFGPGFVLSWLLARDRAPIEWREGGPTGPRRPVLVGAVQDHGLARNAGRATVFVEHGAGQTYATGAGRGHMSYSGGSNREGILLYVAPSETVARRQRAAYPEADLIVAGCPALDPWHDGTRGVSARSRGNPSPTVAVSFHWEANLAMPPEVTGARTHYEPGLPAFVEEARRRGWALLGHGHPRVMDRCADLWDSLGVEVVRDFDDVLDRASVFAADNTSALYEFASTHRPVVVLNAPWYRRDVEHGLRFWEMADVGVVVNEPEELVDGIALALSDPPEVRERRAEIVRAVYVHTDGRATARAVEAIRYHLARIAPAV